MTVTIMALKDGETVHAARTGQPECGEVAPNATALQASPDEVTCPSCIHLLGLDRTHLPVTINGLIEMAYSTATAAGWHDRTGEVITRDHAYFMLAGLTQIKRALGRVVEAIRKPDKYDLQHELDAVYAQANVLRRFGPAFAAETLAPVAGELDTPVAGSLTEVLAWLNLEDSESAEAMEAAIAGDRVNFATEYADRFIRMGDSIGAINDTPDHRLGPIDMEATVWDKNEYNKTRGYRHGNKRA